ncbi:discoidin domain-containing protein [Hymenobacter sp. BT507]|uniref:Discoidin domain-containing protein n=1 Tax=Hymenobacter citatus TaxID=2763506 RepID=A0ABR7MN11_9BACT|nr:glycosyl hydrolase [Hymenobacter citatus]MBC6612471.1 discoidin domain-containing protein [Hymenobacter citatus]
MKTLYSLMLTGALLAGSTAAVAQTAYKSLNFLYSISGTRTASGMHNRQPIATPSTYTNRVQAITGQYPALWSSDFLFEQSEINNRWAMTNEAKAQWAQGALINLMFHACPPTQAEPCQWEGGIKSSLTNAQWQELITDGTQLNRNWKARLDAIVPYLHDLKNNGVEVLFRPLHEMNQGVFWWAGRPGPNGTARLYQITHDYLRNTKGLTNLIWVWNVQDFGSLASDLANYNPGSSYWDVLSLDMYYTDGQGYSTAKYNAMLNAAGGKPIAIGECEVLPSPSLLASQPKWSFFMGWSELVFEKNSNTTIQNTFWANNVLVRDEMPGWGSGGSTPTAPNIAYRRPVSVSSSENSTNTGDKAVDADGNTRWASSYANNQYLYVDLGATYSINRVRLAWEAAYAKDYQVQVSTDNVTWTTVKDVWGKSAAAPDDHTGLNARGRYVKVYCINRATQYGFSLYELEVYGTSVVTATRAATMPVQEGRAASSLAIYPNPTSGMLQVQLPAAQQSSKVVLRNAQGQEVLRKTTNGPTFALDLSHLPAGIYWLTVAGAASQTAQKVVKL